MFDFSNVKKNLEERSPNKSYFYPDHRRESSKWSNHIMSVLDPVHEEEMKYSNEPKLVL